MVFEAKSLVFVQGAIRRHFPEPIKQVGKVVSELVSDPTNNVLHHEARSVPCHESLLIQSYVLANTS